ncbi:MAG: hypothetical protein AUG48_05530 [Actinobacteria bacterium 13_1_20CM_3_68_9]|nr:MAG: hypothetical protein AUG48_05530 [Actinobacteria bacterium 13_1_20CM_3_68_9]
MPWVAVEIAPASVWRSMSPRFSIAIPRRQSAALRSRRVIPASTLTRPDSTSASTTRFSASIRIIAPSVSAASVKEWPEPAAWTVRPRSAARVTARISPSRVRGRSTTAGEQR